MTKEEKEQVYEMLRKTSAWTRGYKMDSYSQMPDFKDDITVSDTMVSSQKPASQGMMNQTGKSANEAQTASQPYVPEGSTAKNYEPVTEAASNFHLPRAVVQEEENPAPRPTSFIPKQTGPIQALKDLSLETVNKAMASQPKYSRPQPVQEPVPQNTIKFHKIVTSPETISTALQEADEAKYTPDARATVQYTQPHAYGSQNLNDVSIDQEQKGMTLEMVEEKIFRCRKCVLSTKRINPVPGEGCRFPLVMVIGEGPGEDEDKTGRPFVGKAGQLLDKMLASISLDRNFNCYIANIVKCRPPANRTPMPDEAQACSGFLQAQIHILKPQLILAMGRTSIQNLLNTTKGIHQLRGQFFEYNGIPVMGTYHPSALLRDEALKRPAWQDLKAFRTRLLELAPDYEDQYKTWGQESK